MQSRRRLLGLIVLASVAATASAGTVKTRSGQTIEGQVRFETGALVVKPATGPEVRIEADQIADAHPGDPPAAPATQPARWESADLNARRMPGRETIDGDRITIHDAATGFRNERDGDSLRFVYQRLPADGQITARIRTFASMRGLVAGLMVRESLDGKSAFAAITRADDFQPTKLVVRKAAGEEYTVAGDADRAVLGASWLRLARKGTRFQAFESPDGKTWWPAGESVVPMLGEAPSTSAWPPRRAANSAMSPPSSTTSASRSARSQPRTSSPPAL